MSHSREPFATDAFERVSYGEIDNATPHNLVAMYSCGRIGRVANPPSFWPFDWFRTARRRRADRVSAA